MTVDAVPMRRPLRPTIFDRLKLIDSAIEALRQGRQALIAQLEVLALEKDE